MKKHTTFFGRLAGVYSLVVLLLIAAFFCLSHYYVVRTGIREAEISQAELAAQMLLQVESFLREMEDVSFRVVTHPQLLGKFQRLADTAEEGNHFERDILDNIDTATMLATINSARPPIWRVAVYDQRGNFISTGASVSKERIEAGTEPLGVAQTIERLDKSGKALEVIGPQPDPWSAVFTGRYITLRRALSNVYSDTVYGVVEIQQSVDSLTARLGFEKVQGIHIAIRDGKDRTVYTLAGDMPAQGRVHEAASRSGAYGWTVVLSQGESNMLEPYRALLVSLLLGSVGTAAVVVAVLFLLAVQMGRPLLRLTRTVSEISIASIPEDLSKRERVDEVRELDRAFTAMLGRLNESVQLEKKAILLALQSQMHPHFLYNMLSVISAAGQEGDGEKVSRMCQTLSSLLRYTAEYGDTLVTLREEMEHTAAYLELMEARYEDYVTWETDIRPEVLAVRLPKMVIQPIVENCFTHGFADREPPYAVKVCAYAEEDCWIVVVEDNGRGFTAQERDAVFRRVEEYEAHLSDNVQEAGIGGLGLMSTILRLRLYLPGRVEVSIASNTPTGAIVMLKGRMG